jgi:hypothetical protein
MLYYKPQHISFFNEKLIFKRSLIVLFFSHNIHFQSAFLKYDEDNYSWCRRSWTTLSKSWQTTDTIVTVIDVDTENLNQLALHLDILTIGRLALTISVLNEAGVAACDVYIPKNAFP